MRLLSTELVSHQLHQINNVLKEDVWTLMYLCGTQNNAYAIIDQVVLQHAIHIIQKHVHAQAGQNFMNGRLYTTNIGIPFKKLMVYLPE